MRLVAWRMLGPLLAVLSLLVTGCGANARPTLNSIEIDDALLLIDQQTEAECRAIAAKLTKATGAHLIIVVENGDPGPTLQARMEELFALAPVIEEPPRRWKLWGATPAELKRQEWSARGILIYVNLQPRVIAVQLGPELRPVLSDKEVFLALERQVVPHLMAKSTRKGVLAAVKTISNGLIKKSPEVTKLGKWAALTGHGREWLERAAFPTWEIYHDWAFKPALNSLMLFITGSGYSVWGAIVWLILLRILTRKNFFGRGIYNLVKALTNRHRKSISLSTVDFIAFVLYFLATLGLALPVFASLSLVTLPSWDRILTVRDSLYPWIGLPMPDHRSFVLANGILWWKDPNASAGLVFGVIFGGINAIKVVYQVLSDLTIANLSDAKRQQIGMGGLMGHVTKAAVEDADYWKGAIMRIILFAAALSAMPFLFSLYFAYGPLVELLPAMRKFAWLRKLDGAPEPEWVGTLG